MINLATVTTKDVPECTKEVHGVHKFTESIVEFQKSEHFKEKLKIIRCVYCGVFLDNGQNSPLHDRQGNSG